MGYQAEAIVTGNGRKQLVTVDVLDERGWGLFKRYLMSYQTNVRAAQGAILYTENRTSWVRSLYNRKVDVPKPKKASDL